MSSKNNTRNPADLDEKVEELSRLTAEMVSVVSEMSHWKGLFQAEGGLYAQDRWAEGRERLHRLKGRIGEVTAEVTHPASAAGR